MERDKAIKAVIVVAVVKVLWTGANGREAGKRATVGREIPARRRGRKEGYRIWRVEQTRPDQAIRGGDRDSR